MTDGEAGFLLGAMKTLLFCLFVTISFAACGRSAAAKIEVAKAKFCGNKEVSFLEDLEAFSISI